MKSDSPYIYSRWADGIFILLPPFLVSAVLFLLPDHWLYGDYLPPWSWLLFIVCIDVAHVYSTLYRSYWSRETFQKYRRAMLLIPALSFATGVILYSTDPMLFWRCLAYLAVFHFIRQQYGFMRIYSRHDKSEKRIRIAEGIVIYSAAIYPMLYWHFAGDRAFHWFIDGDFIALPMNTALLGVFQILYLLTMALWIVLMVRETRLKTWNLPRNLIIAGTYLSWYLGIVYFNGDFAFTALNVISHGIPYMALVWFSYRKKNAPSKWKSPRLSVVLFIVFILSIVGFALVEEGLWDSLHWRDRPEFFGWMYSLPRVQSRDFLSLLVPLLALPQMTHYVLDGFIWKVSRKDVKEEIGIS